jgi:hypothetical protein
MGFHVTLAGTYSGIVNGTRKMDLWLLVPPTTAGYVVATCTVFHVEHVTQPIGYRFPLVIPIQGFTDSERIQSSKATQHLLPLSLALSHTH